MKKPLTKFINYIKKTPLLFISASMTVEAAIVVPIFLIMFINLSASIEMIRLSGRIDFALWDTGREISYYGAFITEPIRNLGSTGHKKISEKESKEKSETLNADERSILNAITSEIGDLLVEEVFIRNRMRLLLSDDYLESSPLTAGAASINLWESDLITGNDIVDIKATYRVKTPIDIIGSISFKMSNRYYAHLWNGYDLSSSNSDGSDEEKKRTVYVTKDSEVYHITSACTYLSPKLVATSYSHIADLETANGEEYTKCLLCARGESPGIIYICEGGDRYHYSRECCSIKREYTAVSYDSVAKTHRACSRCGG